MRKADTSTGIYACTHTAMISTATYVALTTIYTPIYLTHRSMHMLQVCTQPAHMYWHAKKDTVGKNTPSMSSSSSALRNPAAARPGPHSPTAESPSDVKLAGEPTLSISVVYDELPPRSRSVEQRPSSEVSRNLSLHGHSGFRIH